MGQFVYRIHAIQRMFERQIQRSVVEAVVDSGTTIESYPEDTPYPSRLVLGWDRGRPMHVVVADDLEDDETVVTTVYLPDPMRWNASSSRRLQ
ncbi:DUF4258 domain-containing protein [Ferrimicrobium sp.]|uniref:DUF4258 domain-containing protein n=1 Tax=Ferrimicrobium sp. TaxID=2926050 RepID=UPI0026020187|nr:DUF4258 domain-containing protein [Ferrimicrobium sp.]